MRLSVVDWVPLPCSHNALYSGTARTCSVNLGITYLLPIKQWAPWGPGLVFFSRQCSVFNMSWREVFALHRRYSVSFWRIYRCVNKYLLLFVRQVASFLFSRTHLCTFKQPPIYLSWSSVLLSLLAVNKCIPLNVRKIFARNELIKTCQAPIFFCWNLSVWGFLHRICSFSTFFFF